MHRPRTVTVVYPVSVTVVYPVSDGNRTSDSMEC